MLDTALENSLCSSDNKKQKTLNQNEIHREYHQVDKGSWAQVKYKKKNWSVPVYTDSLCKLRIMRKKS